MLTADTIDEDHLNNCFDEPELVQCCQCGGMYDPAHVSCRWCGWVDPEALFYSQLDDDHTVVARRPSDDNAPL